MAVVSLVVACEGETTDAPDAMIERGGAIYAQYCQACHGDAATGAGRVGTAPPHGPTGHTWHHPDSQLLDIILGRFTYPGRTMPSFGGVLSEEEAEAALAYIRTGWTDQQRAYQAEVSAAWEEQRP